MNILDVLSGINTNPVQSSDSGELESLNYSSKDYDSDDEEQTESSVNVKDKIQSILSDLSSIKMDEEKEEEEEDNKDFFFEVHEKAIKKIRLTLSEKKKLIELHKLDPKKYSVSRLARLTGVNPKAIFAYRQSYDEICGQTNLKLCRIKKPTINPWQELDNKLLQFVDKLREEKKAVTTNMLIAKMIQIQPDLKNKQKKTLQQRVYRFLQRNNYSIRKATHIGQPLPSKALDLFYEFFRDIVRKRAQLGIYDTKNDYDRLVNIDETPIFFEMATDKTINKKGVKVISIETKGNEKKLISCVLAVSAGGRKLIPTLIFKGGRDGSLEDKYKNLEVVKNKKIMIYFQYNAWCDETIFKK
jgi:hypothetical protein